MHDSSIPNFHPRSGANRPAGGMRRPCRHPRQRLRDGSSRDAAKPVARALDSVGGYRLPWPGSREREDRIRAIEAGHCWRRRRERGLTATVSSEVPPAGVWALSSLPTVDLDAGSP